MIENCPECTEKVGILTQKPTSPSSVGYSTLANPISVMDKMYPSTQLVYKCSNPKCWVTKIYESWE